MSKRIGFLSFGLKNIWRHRTRAILTVIGIAIATITLFSVLSFKSGYDKALKEEIAGTGIHLFVSTEGCPFQAATLIIHGGEIPRLLDEKVLDEVRSTDGVKQAGGFLIFSAAAENKLDLYYGITTDVLNLKPNWNLEGEWFSDEDSIVLGSEAGRARKLGVGDRYSVPGVDRELVVSAILEPIGSEDDNFIFMPLKTAQEIFRKENQLTAVGVQLEDVTALEEVKREIQMLPGAYVIPAEDLTHRVLELVGGIKGIMFGILVIVLVVSALGVFNTVLMATFERRGEFAYLRCIGAKRRHIFKLITIETLVLCLSGTAIGLAVGLLSHRGIDSWIRGFLPCVPSGSLLKPDILIVAISACIILIIGLIAGLYPGYKASTASPLEAIRHE